MARNLRASIDLTAIRDNYLFAKSLAKTARAAAIIKADAYGHGASIVARYLAPTVDAFGVACIEEALELKEAGITKPVLLLEGFFDADELPLIVRHGFWLVIHSFEQLSRLEAYARSSGSLGSIDIWLKVDTGMHRLGITAHAANEALARIGCLPGIGEVVVMTHFACADELDLHHTHRQIESLSSVIATAGNSVSMSNSAGVLAWPESHYQWIRPGIMLYGGSPFSTDNPHAERLRPAMTLTTELIAIRDVPTGDRVGYGGTYCCERSTRIGTIAVGYADGYSRHARNGTPVYLNGKRACIAGRVSMDMVTIDLTDHPYAAVGDTVELWGENVSVNEVASCCDTIPYVLLSGLTKRIKRQYSSKNIEN